MRRNSACSIASSYESRRGAQPTQHIAGHSGEASNGHLIRYCLALLTWPSTRPSTTANSWTTKDQVSPDDGAAQDETVGPGCASSCRPAYGNLHNHALFFPAVPNSTRRTSPSGPSRDRRAPKPQQRPHDRPPLGGLDGPGMGCWAQPSSSSVECGRSTDLSLVPRTLSLGPCRPTD